MSFRRLIAPLIVLVSGLWLGTHIATAFIGAPAMFRLAEAGAFDSATAGTAAGELFRGQLLASITSLVAIGILWVAGSKLFGRAAIALAVLVALGGLLVLAEALLISPSIHDLRDTLREQYGTVSAAPSDDPNRRQFGLLHGISMIRALGEMLVAAGVAVVGIRQIYRVG